MRHLWLRSGRGRPGEAQDRRREARTDAVHDHGDGAGRTRIPTPITITIRGARPCARPRPRGDAGRRDLDRAATSCRRTTPSPRENRRAFSGLRLFALNVVSSSGSGKTTLLVQTIDGAEGTAPVAVIEGDQQTSNDAERIRATGAPAIQINTGKGCHLDAHMVGHALETLKPEPARRCSSRTSATSFAPPPSTLAKRAASSSCRSPKARTSR